jgi:hypothetical protein
MKKYEELFFQIIRFEDGDVVTGSNNDNVGGANENWIGWSNED